MDYQRLKELHPELEKKLTNMERAGKKAEMMLALQENQVIKDLIAECKREHYRMNMELVTKMNLTDRDRDKLFIERTMCEWFLGKFTGAKYVLKKNEDYLKKYD